MLKILKEEVELTPIQRAELVTSMEATSISKYLAQNGGRLRLYPQGYIIGEVDFENEKQEMIIILSENHWYTAMSTFFKDTFISIYDMLKDVDGWCLECYMGHSKNDMDFLTCKPVDISAIS